MRHDEYISEGYALSEWIESNGDLGGNAKPELLSNLIHNAVDTYKANKMASVGETVKCPTCGKHFIKRSYQHTFCGKRGKGKKEGKGRLCKDTYHNSVDDNRRFRASLFNK